MKYIVIPLLLNTVKLIWFLFASLWLICEQSVRFIVLLLVALWQWDLRYVDRNMGGRIILPVIPFGYIAYKSYDEYYRLAKGEFKSFVR